MNVESVFQVATGIVPIPIEFLTHREISSKGTITLTYEIPAGKIDYSTARMDLLKAFTYEWENVDDMPSGLSGQKYFIREPSKRFIFTINT